MGWQDAPVSNTQGGWRSAPIAGDESNLTVATTTVDRESGAPFKDRLGLSLKFTDKGRAEYLASKYGPENVSSANGKLVFRKPGGNWTQVDEEGLGVGDLADIAPAAGLTATAIATGGVPAMIGMGSGIPAYLATAGGAAGANALMQYAGTKLPGKDDLTMGQRGGMMALDAGLGMAGRGAADLMQNPLKRGTAAFLDATEGSNKAFSQEGVRLSNELGVDLTPGMVSGNRGSLMVENALRSSGASSDAMHRLDIKIAKQFDDRIGQLVNKYQKGDISEEGVGNGIRMAYRGWLNKIDDARNARAAEDYGRVRQLAGDNKVIKFDNTLEELKAIRDEYAGVIGDKESKTIVRQLDAMIREFTSSPPPSGNALPNQGGYGGISANIENAMKTRRGWGRKAGEYSSESMPGVSPKTSRQISSRIFRAINKDFDTSADALDMPELANALRQANTNYSNFMKESETAQKSVVGRLLGIDLEHAATDGSVVNTIPPEKVVGAFLKMPPSQLREAVKVLERVSPDTLSDAKAHVIWRALDDGRNVNFSSGADPIPLSAGKTYKNLDIGDDRMAALFNQSEAKEIKDIMSGLRRWGDRTGYNFSGTETVREINGALNQLVRGSAIGVIGTAGVFFGKKQIAEALSSRNGRQAIAELLRQKPGTRRAKQAAATLAGFGVVSPEMQDEIARPQ